MTLTLTERLVCATYQAYAISGPGPVPAWVGDLAPPAAPIPPASNCTGYFEAPKAFVSGANHEDAGFVGRIPEGVLISIRGTTPPVLSQPLPQVYADWLLDTKIVLGAAAPAFPGKVHPGFLSAYDNLWNKAGMGQAVAASVAKHLADHPSLPKKIFVTGHSKGGAVCALVAWTLQGLLGQHRIVVRTFGSARVGDQAFATAYNAVTNIDHIRYEFDDDIVPHLPIATTLAAPMFLAPPWSVVVPQVDPGYGQVGRLGYILNDEAATIRFEGQTPGPPTPKARIAAIAARLQQVPTLQDPTLGVSYVFDCHRLNTHTNGYVRANYPE